MIMNKRFSTLMVAFMAMGSVLTSAWAQNHDADAAGRVVAAKDLVPGRAYYIATEATTGQLKTTDNFLSISKGNEADPVLTVGNVAVSTQGQLPKAGLETAGDKALWFVTKEAGTNHLSFTNVAGVKLGFAVDGTNAATASAVKVTKFQIVDNALKAVGVSDEAKNYLQIGAATSLSLEAASSSANIAFFEAYDKEVQLNDLVDAEGNGFSLNFAEPLAGDSIFAKVTAVAVTHSSTNTDVYPAAMAASDGTKFYLMTEGTAPDGGFVIGGDADRVAAFDNAKFIVLTATRATGDQFANPANGYRYAVMTGKDLATELKKSNSSIAAGNAQFTASTSANQDGYILTQTGVKVSSEADNATVWVDKVNGFVASNIVDVHKSPVVIEAGKGTAVVVKDLVKGKMVVNVLVEKDDEERNFVSALGLGDADGNVAVIENRKEANLTLPAGQWLMSVAAGNKIDLINLQNPSKKEEGVALYATKNPGEYTVKNSGALNGKLIRFSAIVNPDLYNGYLNLDDKALAGKTFKLSAEAELLGMDVVAYLKANGAQVGVTQLEEEATEWSIEKMTEGVTAAHSATDTLYIKATYKSYDAEGALKEHKNEVIGIAFGYKLTAVGAEAATSGLTGWTLGATPSTILFKQVAADKYAMVAKTNQPVTVDDLNSVQQYAQIGDAGVLAGMSGGQPFSSASQFVLTEVEPAPSIEAAAKHVTFKVNGLNYIAMDKNFNGVVANETSELKAATMEDFTFWIDSVYADAVTPNFFISKGGMMMCNAQFVLDTIVAAEGNFDITTEEAEVMREACKVNGQNRVKFVEATRWANSDSLIIAGDTAIVNDFLFSIVEADEGGYLLKNGANYVGSIGNQLVMTTKELAISVEVDGAGAPTANEGIATSEVKVIAGEGNLTIAGAQGKKVVISNILGQVVANTVIASDNAVIAAPEGVVVVAVEGEAAVKAIVK